MDERWAGFYVMTAVVVQADQHDLLRTELVRRAGSTWWHTAEALQTTQGRGQATSLLEYLGDPDETELCVIAHARQVDPGDTDGEQARAGRLTALMEHLANASNDQERTSLFVLERRRERRQANRDAKTKADAISTGSIPAAVRLLQVSPGDEQLPGHGRPTMLGAERPHLPEWRARGW